MADETPIRKLPARVEPVSPPKPIQDRKAPREWRTRQEAEARRVPAPRSQVEPPITALSFSVDATATEAADVEDSPTGARAGSAMAPAPARTLAPSPPADELPQFRGLDRLVVLVRDPYWVYAWWELGEGTLAEARGAVSVEATLVLRVYDVSAILWDGTNHHTFFDIEIHNLASGWYLELGKPGASFVAEVGLRTADGRFLPILRSNLVTLPRDGMSDVVDEEWMVVEEDYRVLFDLAGGLGSGGDSSDVQRRLEQRLRADLEAAFASRGPTSFGLSSPAARR